MNFDQLLRLFLTEAIAKEEQFNQSVGGYMVPSSKFQNKNGGFDFTIEIKVDYKSAKKLHREDKDFNYDLIWVELKNNYGRPGWLYKQAHLFCFELKNHYLWVVADDLRSLVESNLQNIFTEDRVPYVRYSRKGREDELTLVPTLDLLTLKSSTLTPK